MLRINKRILYYTMFAILLFLLSVRYSFQIDISRTLLTVIVIAMAVLGDRNEVIAISMGCIPLHNAIDFFVTMLACVLILVIKDPQKVKVGFPLPFIGSAIAWEFLHCFAFECVPIELAASLVPLLFIGIYLCMDLNDIDYALVVRTMAFISFYMCFLHILNYIVRADGNLVKAFVNLRRLGSISSEESLFGTKINPNALGVINILGMVSLLQLRFVGKNKKIDLFLFFGLLIFGVLTSSRTFFVCLLLMILLYIMAQKGDMFKKLQSIFMLMVLGVSAWGVLNWLFPSVLEFYFGRFQVGDITTGRAQLMIQYHDFIVNHLWVLAFGIGSANLSDKAVETHEIANNAPHNSIQEIVLAWGIPGLVMITLLIFIMYIESKKYGKKKILLNFIPLIIILTKSMAGQLLTSGYSMLALAFAYLSLCQDFTLTGQTD